MNSTTIRTNQAAVENLVGGNPKTIRITARVRNVRTHEGRTVRAVVEGTNACFKDKDSLMRYAKGLLGVGSLDDSIVRVWLNKRKEKTPVRSTASSVFYYEGARYLVEALDGRSDGLNLRVYALGRKLRVLIADDGFDREWLALAGIRLASDGAPTKTDLEALARHALDRVNAENAYGYADALYN